VVSGLVTVAILLAVPAHARNGPPAHFALPILSLALGRSMLDAYVLAPRDEATGVQDRGRALLSSYLPRALAIPDLYAIDSGERPVREFAAPVDRTKYASFNVLPHRFSQGKALSLGYATESLPTALGGTSSLISISLEIEF